MMVEETESSLDKEYNKLVSRNEELAKQDATLRKEYTTLLRKTSSLASVLQEMDPKVKEMTTIESPKLISVDTVGMAPDLQWYNDQVKVVNSTFKANANKIPEELTYSYKLYKETPLLYKDVQ